MLLFRLFFKNDTVSNIFSRSCANSKNLGKQWYKAEHIKANYLKRNQSIQLKSNSQ